MKATKTEQRALISLLNRIYREIREVEKEWDIRADDHDFRPRIEYFHDAVRAFTTSGNQGSDGRDRLSVEFLAYDISMLRFIQADPLPKAKTNRTLSAHTEVTRSLLRTSSDKTGLKPDSSVKFRLADLYKSYAVMFAALLSEAADRNYQARIHDSHAEVEDMAAFMQSVRAKAGGRGDAEIDLEAMAGQKVQTADLMNKLLAAFHSGKLKKRMQAKDALRKLKEKAQSIDKEAGKIEQAHLTYATSQLAIYESARAVIKKMAFKGFNIVGDFVENAIQDARRGGREM